MKYLKLYEEFVSSDTKIEFGEAELEVKELFRVFSKLKNKLPNEFTIAGEKFKLDKTILGDTDNPDEKEPKEFEQQVEDRNGRHTDTSKSPQMTTDNLLKEKNFTLKNGEKVEASKYYDFIKMCKKLFWVGKKYQMTKEDVKKLAEESGAIDRDDFAKYMGGLDDYNKAKQSYDKTMKFLKDKGAEDLFNTKGLYAKFTDIDKDAYQQAIEFKSYYGGSFDYFDKNIEEGRKMPLSSVIEIAGKWYLVGGNRRMSYYIASEILPTIWLIKLS